MDISNWSMAQIMELPDHLFGRRFYVGCHAILSQPGIAYDISMAALPERFIIWGVCVSSSAAFSDFAVVSLALGDQMPGDDAEFNLLEQLHPGVGARVLTRWDKFVFRNSACLLPRGKVGVESSGRRLVVRYETTLGTVSFLQISLEVSSIPRSIPEWFG